MIAVTPPRKRPRRIVISRNVAVDLPGGLVTGDEVTAEDLVNHHLATNVKKRMLGAVKARFSGAERFGKRLCVKGKLMFDIQGRAVFGNDINIHGDITPVAIMVRKGATLVVGNNVAFNVGVSIEVWREVRIGDYSVFGAYASIIDDDRHQSEPGSRPHKAPVIIEDNVWVGRNVAIMPGVTIGTGSVIAANAVVTKDIPPHCLAGGVPAKVIKELEQPAGWLRP
jgi:acetyltransferase-like isoleucine patch superfamily enzyme